jgi:hypothetical protein
MIVMTTPMNIVRLQTTVMSMVSVVMSANPVQMVTIMCLVKSGYNFNKINGGRDVLESLSSATCLEVLADAGEVYVSPSLADLHV